MTTHTYHISNKKIDCIFQASISQLENYAADNTIVILTDSKIASVYHQQLSAYRVISFEAGEANKIQETVDQIILQLLEMEIDKDALLVGVGGGVVTDITGFVASIYKRGLRFGFVPTTILAMVDAAIGGKNGVNIGPYKNMIGTILQPWFILYDYSFLQSLPHEEWVNGFAEIIKHACIKDPVLFASIQQHQLSDYMQDTELLSDLIQKNVALKFEIVALDEMEKNERLHLNFGHTIGHAIENTYQIKHGAAVAIGMVIACHLSESLSSFDLSQTVQIVQLIKQYQLPTGIEMDVDRIIKLVLADKKRAGKDIRFVLLNSIGEAAIQLIPIETIRTHLIEYTS